MKVWGLFGQQHEYNSTEELITLYQKKPHLNSLAHRLFKGPLESLSDERIIQVVALSRGDTIDNLDDSGTDFDSYSLIEVTVEP